MALNTDFVAGNILTAAQQNNFPRGLISATGNLISSGSVSVETLSITSPSFTAVAGRYYRISYFEPAIQYVSGTVNFAILRIRLTNIAGTEQVFNEVKIGSASDNSGICQTVRALTAGSTVFVATFAPSGGGNLNCFRSATATPQLIIEDVGSS
jgi:hypothetical protein